MSRIIVQHMQIHSFSLHDLHNYLMYIIQYMIKNGVKKFIEIGPGKVLTGLVKRIDKNVESYSINNDEDIKKININD